MYTTVYIHFAHSIFIQPKLITVAETEYSFPILLFIKPRQKAGALRSDAVLVC